MHYSDVKLYRGIPADNTDDDALLESLLDAAQSAIDGLLDREFDLHLDVDAL
jgi:hypothetical protein